MADSTQSKDRVETEILKNRNKPSHPTFNRGINNVYSYYKKKPGFEELTVRRVKSILSKDRAYTLHRPYKRIKHYNPTFSHDHRHLIEIDLVEIMSWGKTNLSRKNGNVKYICVAIDVFSRFVICEPLKNKTSANVLEALKSIERKFLENRPDKVIRRYYFDKGLEFKAFERYLNEKGVKYSHSYSERKASIVESVLKVLQKSIYEWMTNNASYRYIDVLQDIVKSYNLAKHSFFKRELSPLEAELETNRDLVQLHHSVRYLRAGVKSNRTLRFNVGDIVRVKIRANKFKRGYHFQFSEGLYKVVESNTHLPVISYNIQSLQHGKIYRSFYGNELQTVRYKNGQKIENVLTSRINKVRGGRDFLIKLSDSNNNVWVHGDELKARQRQ